MLSLCDFTDTPLCAHAQVIQEIKNKFFKDQTIAPGTVSVHIRRGNKAGGEMSYVPDETFLKYIRALQAGNADVLKQAVFVSTEDPKALQAVQSNMTAPWAVQFTTVPRNNHNGGQTVSVVLGSGGVVVVVVLMHVRWNVHARVSNVQRACVSGSSGQQGPHDMCCSGTVSLIRNRLARQPPYHTLFVSALFLL